MAGLRMIGDGRRSNVENLKSVGFWRSRRNHGTVDEHKEDTIETKRKHNKNEEETRLKTQLQTKKDIVKDMIQDLIEDKIENVKSHH